MRSEPDHPVSLLMDRSLLAHPEEVAIHIAECLDPQKAHQFRQTHGRTMTLLAGIASTTAPWNHRTVAGDLLSPSFTIFRRPFLPRIRKRPICLRVEEIQKPEVVQAGTLEALYPGTADLLIVPGLAKLVDFCSISFPITAFPGSATIVSTVLVASNRTDRLRWFAGCWLRTRCRPGRRMPSNRRQDSKQTRTNGRGTFKTRFGLSLKRVLRLAAYWRP